ncbi:exodeoxyribonuclease VII large subunit, partial [Roseivivax isoporae]|uniref:exodeoxyribonuclease VII large subunit n=1 Tax=Roseivivax isoporae TaxID=591206 RepID=UPI0005C18C85
LAEARRDRLARLSDRIAPGPLADRLARRGERLSDLGRRLDACFRDGTAARRSTLDALERIRVSLGYEATLERGFAVVRGDGQVVTTRAAAAAASGLEIQFRDGRLRLGGTAPKPAPRARKPEQGSLF